MILLIIVDHVTQTYTGGDVLTLSKLCIIMFTAVCVAGYSSSKNEILELLLPLKLFADENKVTICVNFIYLKINTAFSRHLSLC